MESKKITSFFQDNEWRNNRHFLNPSKLKEYELHLRGLGFLNNINPFYDYFEKITPLDDLNENFLKELNKKTTLYLIRKDDAKEEIKLCEKYGFKLKNIWGTFILDTDKITLNRNTQRNIKKSENDQSEFIIINNLNDLNEYYQGLKKYRKNIGFNTAKFGEYKKIFTNKYYKAFLLKIDKIAVAGLGILHNKNYAIEINSFSFLSHTNDYLKYKILKYCQDEKIKYYDFAGCHPNPEIGSKEYGIKKYKEKWGGEYYNIYTLKK